MNNNNKLQAVEWFKSLRDEICKIFEQLELENNGQMSHEKPGIFSRKNWARPGGGGGEMSIMRGRVFEKVGVNFSEVYGRFSESMMSKIKGASKDPNFWAAGISIVCHLQSPIVPAIHMNTRHIITSKSWFGGGTDLTPIIKNDEDKEQFHSALKVMCDKHDKEYYYKFKKWCDDYFYLKHRKEPRGAGGIFYDDLNSGNWQKDFMFTKDVGKTFKDIYPKIVRKHFNKPWTEEQREHQLVRRGRYVEFNLVYDRGTRFGLETEGNVEAILMSLPPEVKWP